MAAKGSRFVGMANLTYGTGTGKMAAAGGGVALFDNGNMNIDSVGWGTAKGSYVEDQAGPPPGELGASRLPDGVDTNRNQVDFKAAPLTPKAKNHM